MTIQNTKFKYAYPRAEELLKITVSNIIRNLQEGNSAVLSLPPIVQMAYTIVNETGVLPYRDYAVDTKFLGGQ